VKLTRIADSAAIILLTGIALAFVLPAGCVTFYVQAALLIAGSLLGLAFTLWPKTKPKSENVLLVVGLEFVCMISLLLKSFRFGRHDIVPAAFYVAVFSLILMFGTLFTSWLRSRSPSTTSTRK